MGNAYRVLLLVYGAGLMAEAARGGVGPPRPVASLNDQRQYFCSLLPNCTTWCTDCRDRDANNLFDLLEDCYDFKHAPNGSYRYVNRCSGPSSHVACICTKNDAPCKRCQYTEQNNLVCFSQENADVHVWPGSSAAVSFVLLEEICPSCSCSTNRPTTPQPATTPEPLPTNRIDQKIEPRPSDKSLTTDAGNTDELDVVVIIAGAVGGGALLITVIVLCICYQKKCRKKPKSNSREQEYAYIDTEEMRTFRSQTSIMTSQQLVSNEGIHPGCGHRNFNNEMYGLNKVGNGSTLPTRPPELPGNHPLPANSPPAPYQELNRGQVKPADLNAAAAAGGQCPRCGQLAAEKSATAPLLDRSSTAAVDGATNPYMALIKTNTCPTPGTPSEEPMCRCHARPLSECSSVTGSVLSEPQSSHAGAVATLDSTSQGSDLRPLSGTSDTQESPYYFKVNTAGDKDAVLSPKSNQYFKLEDAETLPLDRVGEVGPMLPEADNNGNNVALKPDLSGKPSLGQGKGGYMSLPNKSTGKLEDVQPSSDVRGQTLGGTVSQEAAPVESTPIVKGSNLGSVEGLPNGDYMQLVEEKKRSGVSLESAV